MDDLLSIEKHHQMLNGTFLVSKDIEVGPNSKMDPKKLKLHLVQQLINEQKYQIDSQDNSVRKGPSAEKGLQSHKTTFQVRENAYYETANQQSPSFGINKFHQKRHSAQINHLKHSGLTNQINNTATEAKNKGEQSESLPQHLNVMINQDNCMQQQSETLPSMSFNSVQITEQSRFDVNKSPKFIEEQPRSATENHQSSLKLNLGKNQNAFTSMDQSRQDQFESYYPYQASELKKEWLGAAGSHANQNNMVNSSEISNNNLCQNTTNFNTQNQNSQDNQGSSCAFDEQGEDAEGVHEYLEQNYSSQGTTRRGSQGGNRSSVQVDLKAGDQVDTSLIPNPSPPPQPYTSSHFQLKQYAHLLRQSQKDLGESLSKNMERNAQIKKKLQKSQISTEYPGSVVHQQNKTANGHKDQSGAMVQGAAASSLLEQLDQSFLKYRGSFVNHDQHPVAQNKSKFFNYSGGIGPSGSSVLQYQQPFQKNNSPQKIFVQGGKTNGQGHIQLKLPVSFNINSGSQMVRLFSQLTDSKYKIISPSQDCVVNGNQIRACEKVSTGNQVLAQNLSSNTSLKDAIPPQYGASSVMQTSRKAAAHLSKANYGTLTSSKKESYYQVPPDRDLIRQSSSSAKGNGLSEADSASRGTTQLASEQVPSASNCGMLKNISVRELNQLNVSNMSMEKGNIADCEDGGQMLRHVQNNDVDFSTLFANLGLNYEHDVPESIKLQLHSNKNSKLILEQLAEELKKGGSSKLSTRPSKFRQNIGRMQSGGIFKAKNGATLVETKRNLSTDINLKCSLLGSDSIPNHPFQGPGGAQSSVSPLYSSALAEKSQLGHLISQGLTQRKQSNYCVQNQLESNQIAHGLSSANKGAGTNAKDFVAPLNLQQIKGLIEQQLSLQRADLLNDYTKIQLDAYKKKLKMFEKAAQKNSMEFYETLNPNACYAVKPGEPCHIKILNEPLKKHISHPINKFLKLVNDFCYISLVKAQGPRNSASKQMQFDLLAIQQLSRQLKIEVPKNISNGDLQGFFKSKQFVVHAKGQILQKLNDLMNKHNNLTIHFERSHFQFYKCFIGRGNNSDLLVQLFKQHRWWWSVHQSLAHDTDGNIILPPSLAHNQTVNLQLYRENFTEHNFLWTQWKKQKHFQFLKPCVEPEGVGESISAGAGEGTEDTGGATTGVKNACKDVAASGARNQGEGPEISGNHGGQKNQEHKENNSNSFKVYAKIENNFHLANKYALFYNMRKFYRAHDRDPFDVLPITYHIRFGTNDPEFKKFTAYFAQLESHKNQAQKEEKELNKLLKSYSEQIKTLQDQIQKLTLSLKEPPSHPPLSSNFPSTTALDASPHQSQPAAPSSTHHRGLSAAATTGQKKKKKGQREAPAGDSGIREREDVDKRQQSCNGGEKIDRRGQKMGKGETNGVMESVDRDGGGGVKEGAEEKLTFPEVTLTVTPLKQKSIVDEESLRKEKIQRQQTQIEITNLEKQLEKIQQKHQDAKQVYERTHRMKQMKNIWIVKPGENTNRGVGISVQTKLTDIKQLVGSESHASRTFILQKYIENPALYKNRKFDIRCFAMVTSVNGHQKAFIYDDGYLRTSAREYNLKNFNKFIHLTNDAVQKRSDDYGRFEFGNKVSFSDYQLYLNQTVPLLNIDFRLHIFSQIKRIMSDTLHACYNTIDPKRRQHSFEIFGYDFMLDENFKVYLIEANTNPCLETTCPILQKIITDVVDSALRISLDPLFPPPTFQKRLSMQVPLTLWELCYDSRYDWAEMEELYEAWQGRQEEVEGGGGGEAAGNEEVGEADEEEEDEERE